MASDFVQQQIPSAEIVILGDFNAHHADWLSSSKTDHAGRSVHDFALAYGLTQLVSSPTRIPDVDGHDPSLLDLLLTSHPDGYHISVDAPLGSSDHCLVRSTVPLTCSPRPRVAGSRRVWHYKSADWDGMRSFFASYPWRQVCFPQDDPSAAADSVADVVLQEPLKSVLNILLESMGCLHSRRPEEEDMIYDMTPIRHLPVIFVNGVPGAGNQTVAQTISDITGYTMIRPGDLVRTEALKDTARGRLIADKLLAGEDTPEQLTVDLIKEAMLTEQEAAGFILVGFPKNPRMSNIFNRQVKWPEKIVALEVEHEVAATRLQNKLSELGRPESEINAARQIIKEAAHKVKNVHKRLGRHVVTLDSTGNPKALASTLKEILSDTIEKAQKRPEPPELEPPTSCSAPAVAPAPAPAQCPASAALDTPPPVLVDGE